MFRKLLLVGGFDMVQLIHIINGPIYLAHRIQQSISKQNFYLNNCCKNLFQLVRIKICSFQNRFLDPVSRIMIVSI